MSKISHKVTHYYQPSNHSCSQTAMAILLSHYGYTLSPDEIMAKIPVNKDDNGNDVGTIVQHLATWVQNQGFKVHMYSADFQVLDLSWANLNKKHLKNRMNELVDKREVPAIGKDWSKQYMLSYIDFIDAGGELSIVPFISSDLLNKLIYDGPILTTVCYNVMYNTGRSRNTGLRESVFDDEKGNLTNHNIVIYGIDDDGNFLVADPYKIPGRLVIDKETMVVAISSAQIECDNFLFQVNKVAR